MKTFGSLFSGGGGADLGAKAVGLEVAWGNELLPEIAEVGNLNLGKHIRVGDILEQDPYTYERVDVMHMSPPCTRASNANNSAEINEDGLKESPLDIALANKCIEFVETLQPEIVTLENVFGYRKFQSWRGGKKCEGVQSALHRLGYWVSVEHVNSADYGVPQTRKRMIVRAVRNGFVPYLPQSVPWIGWYAAIEDILPTLPDSQFADWQLKRLPKEICDVLIDSKNAGQEFGKLHRTSDEPAFTITADGKPSHMPKAFIVDCQKSGEITGDSGLTIRLSSSPCFAITSGTGQKRPARAYDGICRVVSMTPRCLARFQSFPDDYLLPPNNTLATRILGNAVPPLLYEIIIGQLIQQAKER